DLGRDGAHHEKFHRCRVWGVSSMIAVISDIHGNLWALEAVLQDLDRLGPSQVIVAGDLALGGPRPAECVEFVRRRGYPAIRGNTDEWLTSAPDSVTDAIGWAATQMSDADRRYLAGLRRVQYDTAAAIEALRGSGNPEAERFARRLQQASTRQQSAEMKPKLSKIVNCSPI